MLKHDDPPQVSEKTFWLGVAVMFFYVLDCVGQNELFSWLERGSGNTTCTPTINNTNVDIWLAVPLHHPHPSTTYMDVNTVVDDWYSDEIETSNTSSCGEGHAKFDRPFFIVWWNHCFIALVLPPLMLYLAFFADVPHELAHNGEAKALLINNDNVNTNKHNETKNINSDEHHGRCKPRPPPGLSRITWYINCYDLSWKQLCWTSLWAGALFLSFNYLWYVGLPMPGMIPSEASAAANSSFAWVYVMSLFMLNERVDVVKVIAVLGCLAGVVLLAISGWLESLPKNETHTGINGTEASEPKFHMSTGILVEFACAILQGVYLVAFKKWALRGGRFPAKISAIIAGFEGLVHLFIFWIFFVIFDYAGVEKFVLPTAYQAQMLAIGATITATGCVAIMVGLALLPNPLIVSVASLVTTPAQYIADLVLHPDTAKSMSTYEIAGGVLVVITFAMVIVRDAMLVKTKRHLDAHYA